MSTNPTNDRVPKKAGNSDLAYHACVYAIIHFVDGFKWKMHSYDCQHKRTYRYHNKQYWVSYLQDQIQNEKPKGWKGRVLEAAIFHNDHTQHDTKIAQFDKWKGWTWERQ